jgi:hypothetical protein
VSRIKDQVFIIDADAWIACYEERYPTDVFPKLWDHLREVAADEMILTTRHVVNEVGDKRSGVSAWIRALQPTIVLRETPGVVHRMNEVVERFPDLTRGIAESADPWLVAHAMGRTSAVVVTQEGRRKQNGKPKLPDVCQAFGVQTINSLTMFRRLSFRLG